MKNAGKAGPSKNYSWLDSDTVDVGMEMIVLYKATPVNNYLSVTLYADRDAETKAKPLNSRANAIVLACGIEQKLIHGDIFLARTYDNMKASQGTWLVVQ